MIIREEKVLEIRFGLKDGVIHTLEEVAQTFGLTRERIRQLEAKAIEGMTGVKWKGVGQGNVARKEAAQFVKEVYQEYIKTSPHKKVM